LQYVRIHELAGLTEPCAGRGLARMVNGLFRCQQPFFVFVLEAS
jgi:hypothetical protein